MIFNQKFMYWGFSRNKLFIVNKLLSLIHELQYEYLGKQWAYDI